MTKYFCEISASSYYEEICNDARSREGKKKLTLTFRIQFHDQEMSS